MNPGRGAKGKATVLHSQIVRSRGRCERCGVSNGTLQCAHIVGRSWSWTRTDEHNAWCLCAKCHFFLTGNPFDHVQFAIQTRGEDGYAALRRKALEGVNRKFDWDAELVRLRALADSLGVAA